MPGFTMEEEMTKHSRIVLVLLTIAALTGCAGMTTTQQRVLSGGAIGTAAGVGTAAVVGAPLAAGAVVGAAAGAVGGYIVDELR
jgi:membrane associated rhomboid family serine protease